MEKKINGLTKIYHQKILLVAGITFGSIGVLGNFVLWALSKKLPVHIAISKGQYVIGNILGYDFYTFISEYRLGAIWGMLLVFLLVGIILLVIRFRNIVKIKRNSLDENE